MMFKRKTFEIVYPECLLIGLSYDGRTAWKAAFDIGSGYIDVEITMSQYAEMYMASAVGDESYYTVTLRKNRATVTSA